MYHKDLNYDDILNECEHLKHFISLNQNSETLPARFGQFEISIQEHWSCTSSVYVHNGDQLYMRTFFFKTKTDKKCGAASFEQLAFIRVHGKWHPEHGLPVNNKAILWNKCRNACYNNF